MKLIKTRYLILIDCAAIGLALVVFALFDHVIPHASEQVVVVPQTAYTAVVSETQTQEEMQTEEAVQETPAQVGIFDFPGVFTDGEVIVTDTSYKSANVSITLTNVTYSTPSKQCYFVEDIYIRSIDCLRCVFAKDTYGKSISENFEKLATRSSALAAINTDYYGWGSRTGGLVIRNGVLYRSETARDEDMLVIYRDGSMQPILAGSTFDPQALIDAGAWQAYSFGPSLLDENGNKREDLEKTNHDPRTVLGMIEPGHYVFIVFDGRQDSSYAKGYTYRTAADVCVELGCKVAFNLDGGESSQMAFMGKRINKPYKDGRSVSDILMIGELQ